MGPLDHIIMGFQPPPLDFQPNPEIELFATIQEKLDALAAPDAQPPVVSTVAAENTTLNARAVHAAPMDALTPPPQQLLVDAAPAPPVQPENTQAELP